MPLTLTKNCSMGGSQTGLVGTIGVTLLNPDGTVHTARATAGIYEIGGGCYGDQITFADDWIGSIKWDTGGGTPVYAVEEYSYYENNPKVDVILTDTDNLQTNQSDWLTATSVTVSDKNGFSLSDAGVDAILDEVVEGAHTMRELLRLFAAAWCGKSSGGGSATLTFRGIDDDKDRIVAICDANGNRSVVVLTED